MRIGIIGTRGIPNEYGGFEQFAMHFAKFLVEQNHEVVVYNSSNHPYKQATWRGVEIVSCWDPEKQLGTIGQFVYDLGAILNSRNQDFDVIFQLGYTSSSVWGFLFPKKPVLITNMDGQEWKRSKYNPLVQKFLKRAEKWAVKRSDKLIADSRGIKSYLETEYGVHSHFIAYGADIIKIFDETILEKYGLNKYKYDLIIARLEPENNIETIVRGHQNFGGIPLVVIGDFGTKHGSYLEKKYGSTVTFLGANYNFEELNSLRHFARLYFHGHSVGGTNPSLLEAMACGCAIVSHDNPFNRDVLEENANYFTSAEEVAEILQSYQSKNTQWIANNYQKIESVYSFDFIHNQLLNLMQTS